MKPSAGSTALLALALLAGLAGCESPPSHMTRLWPEGRTGMAMLGLSTEDGVLIVASPQFAVGDRFEIHFPVGNSLVRDWGEIVRSNEHLAVVRPLTARLLEGRLASALPRPGEEIYLGLRDERDEPVMEPAPLWDGGAHGDWLLAPRGREAAALARGGRGTGVYVRREGRWEIIGLLAGLTARTADRPGAQAALGFIGLPEIARILPERVDYFDQNVLPLRPDFEFGVPLQPGDIDLDAASGSGEDEDETETEDVPPVLPPLPAPTPVPAPVPAPTPGTPPPAPAPGPR